MRAILKTTIIIFISVLGISKDGVAQAPTAGPGVMTSRSFALPTPEIQQTWSKEIYYNGVVVDRYRPEAARQIGIYKVTGSPYLFSGPVRSDVFSVNGVGYNVITAYDTYDQKLEIFQGKVDLEKILVKNVNEIDSFSLTKDSVSNRILFINSKHLGDEKGIFVQQVLSGKNYKLYKAYKSELESTDTYRNELKEFSLKTYYYYSSDQKKGIKKIKPTKNWLRNEFPGRSDVDGIITAGDMNTDLENVMLKVFMQLNSK